MMADRGTFRGVAGGPVRHIPVMLPQVIEALEPRDGAVYVDGTFGAGGYSLALLEAARCTVLAIDRDPDAIAAGKALKQSGEGRLLLCLGRFSTMQDHCLSHGFEHVDGVTLDLGVSSMQLNEAERGFSFMQDGPLDMRMGRDGPSAADVVNGFAAGDLARIIKVFGEEPRARRIAQAIVAAREDKAFTRTLQLADTVSQALGGRRGARIHPATRTFQALRMFVNSELDEVVNGLSAAERVLREGGRLAVVSFQSLEDRLVKRFIRGETQSRSRHMPEAPSAEEEPAFREIIRGGQTPPETEIDVNPRARSARLRAAVRTGAPARARLPANLGLPEMPALPQ